MPKPNFTAPNLNSTHKIAFFTLLALFAFAGNSILCRLALLQYHQDPLNFTLLRLLSGAAVLLAVQRIRRHRACAIPFRPKSTQKPHFSLSNVFSHIAPSIFLFGYCTGFSYAYTSLSTGAGALILFSTVQLTLLVRSRCDGFIPNTLEYLGMAMSVSGLYYLTKRPSAELNSHGIALMCIAGICWGLYTYSGRKSIDATYSTLFNFILASAIMIVFYFPLAAFTHPLPIIFDKGFLFALASGGITSGLGYAIWYGVVKHLSPTLSGLSQLTVPLIATAGGLLFVGEAISLSLVVGTISILGGIGLTLLAKNNAK